MNKKYTLFSAIVIVLVFVFIFFANNQAEANHHPNVKGWGWSSNIGWISFNGSNCDANGDGLSDGTNSECPLVGQPVPDYGVNQDVSGNLTGYGWSSNVGWMSFEPTDLTGCPTAPCTATVNLSTGLLSGWAKFLNGNTTSGWDGWVKLSGTSQAGGAYGVTFNASARNYSGYAWGADVVGWMDWSDVIFAGTTPPIVASCTIDKATAHLNDNVTWTATATGGSGTYTYLWFGSAPLATRTNRIETVQYTSLGSKWGRVTVSSPGSTSVTTELCLNPLGTPSIDIQPTLTTGITGAGPGTINDTPNVISCATTTCTYDKNVNTQINLIFTPSPGTKFLKWIDQSGNTSTLCTNALSSTCTFTLTGNAYVKASTRKTECNDGVDNDNDKNTGGGVDYSGAVIGGVSYPKDPQCANIDDDTEAGVNQCSDGIDNADPEDTLVDACDPGCHANGIVDPNNCSLGYDPNDSDETDTFVPTCNDHIDQGGDGTCDWGGCTINGVALPPDPSCDGNPYNNNEGESGDIHEF